MEPGEVPSDAMLAVEETQVWPEDMGEDDVALAAKQGKASVVIHKVVAGESLASIAEKYGVTPMQIKENNNLRRNAIRVGQQLRITTTNADAIAAADLKASEKAAPKGYTPKASAPKKTSTKSQKAATSTTHRVRNGETLSSIAKKIWHDRRRHQESQRTKSDNLSIGKKLIITTKYNKQKII